MDSAAKLAAELYLDIVKELGDRQRAILFRELTSRADELAGIVDELDVKAGDAPATLLREATGKIRGISVQLKQMAAAVRQPFMLFVVGMGKFGKSTLINALLGARVADMDVLPKTWKIDVFSAQRPPDRVLVKMRTGAEQEMTVKQAREFLAQEESKWADSKSKVDAELRRKLPSLTTVEQREEYKAFLRKRLLYQSPVSEVHWPCPESRLLKRFNIVDTPGLFQELLTDDTEMRVRDYYHKADGVLWLLDATKVTSQKPHELLRELDKALEEVGGRTDNIVAVLNRIDQVGDHSTRQRVLEEAHRIFGDKFRVIIPFSAKGALLAVERNDRAQMEENGLNALIRAIENHFLSRAVRLQKESKVVGLKGYINDAAKIAAAYVERLETDEAKRKECARNLEEAVGSFQNQMRKRVETVLSSYREETASRIDTLSENTFHISDDAERDKYVREEIFDERGLDRLFKSLESSITVNAKAIFEAHRAASIFREFEHLDEIILPSGVIPGGQFADTDVAGVDDALIGGQALAGLGAAVLAAILLGPVGILAGLLAFTRFGKQLMISLQLPGLKSKLINQLDKCVDNSMQSYGKAILDIAHEIRNSVSSIREKSFASLHGPSRSVPLVITNLGRISSIGDRPVDLSCISLIRVLKGEGLDA